MKNFPEILKELRKNRNLNQTQVASVLGFTYFTYGKWEQGKAEPSLSSLQKLADFFHVSTDDLLGRTEDELERPVPADLPEEENKLLNYYRGLDKTQQRAILRTAESLYTENQQGTRRSS